MINADKIQPTKTPGAHAGDSHDTYTHPAYGTIQMTIQGGSSETLFGSDLGHGQRVCITINRATMNRHLNRDWIHQDHQIVEFEMSHAQFAQFITSAGRGSGTPCTLRWVTGEGSLPGIANIETKHETFRREIHEASRTRLNAIEEQIKSLGALIESGKLPKSELREIHKELARHAEQLPGTMEFVVKSAEKALEQATSDAKIEVESYVTMTAQRLGLEQIQDLARLENKA